MKTKMGGRDWAPEGATLFGVSITLSLLDVSCLRVRCRVRTPPTLQVEQQSSRRIRNRRRATDAQLMRRIETSDPMMQIASTGVSLQSLSGSVVVAGLPEYLDRVRCPHIVGRARSDRHGP